MEIKYHRKLQMDDSIMVAGWPGMGSVAVDSVNYVRRKLNARFLAEISTNEVYTPEGVVIDKGIISFPREPVNLFYYRKNPPVIFLEGSHQFSGQQASLLVKKVLDVAKNANVKRIITSAAFPTAMNYHEGSQVYVAANNVSFLNYFTRFRLKALKMGQISGLNGMLLGHAKTRGIDAACLLATIPQYSISIPNPRAVIEVADIISSIIDVSIDLEEIDGLIEDMDRRMELIENKLKVLLPRTFEEEQQPELCDREKVPSSILEKIEKMFAEVKQDKKKASLLKEELDRWELYRIYEDRFLDLFRKTY